MAQVTFVGAGAGAAVAGLGSISVPYPTGLQANDFLILFIVGRSNDGFNMSFTASGFSTSISGGSNYSGFTFSEDYSIVYKISNGLETGNMTVTINGDTANKLKFARMYAFRNARTTSISGLPQLVPSSSWDFSFQPPQSLNSGNSGTTNTVVFGDVWSPYNDSIGICFVNVWDDNPQTAPTNATGGTWTEPIAEFTSTAGTDGSLGIFTVPLSENQLVTGGSFSMGGGAADPWHSNMFTLVAQTPSISFTPVDPFGRNGFFGL